MGGGPESEQMDELAGTSWEEIGWVGVDGGACAFGDARVLGPTFTARNLELPQWNLATADLTSIGYPMIILNTPLTSICRWKSSESETLSWLLGCASPTMWTTFPVNGCRSVTCRSAAACAWPATRSRWPIPTIGASSTSRWVTTSPRSSSFMTEPSTAMTTSRFGSGGHDWQRQFLQASATGCGRMEADNSDAARSCPQEGGVWIGRWR